ncbi:hypothetical protein BGZ76_000032 [Entomortierella beljakovae]|nr:hypothetical protein BGZ76_000032 [Entomortierella beljakovae]
MAPPKKATATLDTATNFFQRGRKPTTAQRIITAKKANATLDTPKKLIKLNDEESDQIDEADSSEEEDEASHDSDEHENASVDDQEEPELFNDEIQSDSSDDSDSASDFKKSTVVRETVHEGSKTADIVKAKPTKKVTANRKTTQKSEYVAPYVGDIYNGFHQGDIPETEKILRQFDLASKYGPCTELTRLERWDRAFELGLNPPREIKDMIEVNVALNKPVFEGRV